MFIKYIFLISLFCQVYTQEEELVDLYEEMIREEIDKSSKYQFPKDASEYEPNNVIPKDFGEFDFVVIGGGSAGAVAASRLSDISEWDILLLEAGKDETNFTEIPAMGKYVQNSEYNWGFNSTPQDTCCLDMKGVCPFPRGKSLGGTSAINSLVYCRGSNADYDKWAEEGNSGWAYKDVLPYFMLSENSHIDGDDNYHGFNGNLNVNYHNSLNLKTHVFLKANQELEIPILDYNGKNQLGASLTQFNVVEGKRDSSNRAFLKPAEKRTNLRILTESYVTKVLISNKTKEAYGVIFSHKNIKYIVTVRKEVVLSGGVVGSPQILMLSGIGPKEHLEKHGINVIKDLAVGENLHDHTTFYNLIFKTSKVNKSPDLRESIKEYLNGSGPLTTVDDNEALGFYHLRLNNNSKGADFEIITIPSVMPNQFDTNIERTAHGRLDSMLRHSLSIDISERLSQLVVVLLHPKSRGKIYLKSNNPFEYPLIQSTCLDDPENDDIENLYDGVQAAIKLLNTNTYRNISASLIPHPQCFITSGSSKEYWMCNIRHTAMNAYHGAGTCKMGSDPARGAVVDNKLQVHGIKRLRIADTSVIPVTLSAHMNAPAMMIGERVADFIKYEYKYKTLIEINKMDTEKTLK